MICRHFLCIPDWLLNKGLIIHILFQVFVSSNCALTFKTLVNDLPESALNRVGKSHHSKCLDKSQTNISHPDLNHKRAFLRNLCYILEKRNDVINTMHVSLRHLYILEKRKLLHNLQACFPLVNITSRESGNYVI